MRLSWLYALGLAVFSTHAADITRTLKLGFNVNANKRSSELSARAPQTLEGAVTNAERLARGLPLLKPRRRSSFPRQSTPSSVPPVEVTCNIQIDAVDPDAGPTVFYDVRQSQNDADALVVSFSYTPGSTSHVSMPLWDNYPYFAAIITADSDSNDLGSTSKNYAYLGKSLYEVPQAEGRRQPQIRTGTPRRSVALEPRPPCGATILARCTGALTPTWINTDGQPVPAYVMYDSWNMAFFISGRSSIGAEPEFTYPPVPVTFTCVTPVPIVIDTE
ncbi:hypothetical protein FB45DRAFT_1029330 [Roridomyces roridus]|uniref:Uncharacterized protein n=1 Tax=Roridomyces roridus TaxID=1738132 RepID=A0AAD7BPJ9_9AGAR|nr:hypothetical protein FB45DRAFT_1029330 [Roridomyces roridus]